ncbi:MAG: PEGA domain-containing protein [Vicinamibacterales bacterium]|jgi:hypothetical protein|nr:PEGA domain-containing protein [Vicinamibacterales bacterium]
MRKVFVEPVVLPEPRFRDGLGVRYVRTDGTDDPVEVLRPLWDVGSMQNAIRQRVSRLSSFRQARFVPVRAAEVPPDDASTIEVVSDFVSGHRLSQYLEAAQAGTVSIEASTAIHILREMLGALALLHESRGVTHGAVGPERILITPKGRVVVADYVLGPAIERLEFTRARIWREFRIPLPAGKGMPKLDGKADVVQVGVTALALLLGRPIEIDEYPGALDDLLAALNQTHRAAGRPPLPAALVAWVKRAVLKDPAAKFDHVSDARMSLEGAISKQDAATGGAAALKSLAEVFGRYAAAEDARAAAAAAEEARKIALAAQAAAMDVIRAAAAEADAAGPAADAVPAFTLLSEAPAAPLEGTAQAAALEAEPVPAAVSDPPVGWRVPEAPPVEETLPTSPLLQIDAPAAAPPAEEFVEEVLDLGGLASSDDDGPMSADEVAAAEAVAASFDLDDTAAPAAAASDGCGEVIVDLRELNAAGSPAESPEAMAVSIESEPASLDLGEAEAAAVAADPEVAPPQLPIETIADVDAALAALAALEEPAPQSPVEALPEWRLLADPVGAVAPTIDAEEPTETLEELVAAFAAIGEAPAAAAERPAEAPYEPSIEILEPPAVVTAPASAMVEAPAPVMEPPVAMAQASIPVMEPPVAMVEARARLTEAPAGAWEPVPAQMPEETAPRDAMPSVLDEILGLQEAQAAAQAAAEIRPEVPVAEPDIAAWGFVEELMHRDERYAAPPAPADVPPQPVVEEAPPQPVLAEDARLEAPACAADVEAVQAPDAVAPAVEEAAPELPSDWFIEVGLRPAAQAPVPAGRTECAETLQAEVPVQTLEPPPAFIETIPDGEVSLPAPVARRAELPEPVDDANGPVFPRIAPSVQRVRAEARRRRLARLSSSVGQFLRACGSACATGVSTVAGGFAQACSTTGRGAVAGTRAVLAGLLFAVTSVARGIGGLVRAAATGTSAVLLGAATAGATGARAVGAACSAAAKGAGRGLHAMAAALRASAAMAAKAAVFVTRAAGGAVSASARGLAAGLGAVGRAGRTGALAGLRATGRVMRAGASAAAATGRFVAAMSAGLGRAAGRAAGRGASAAAGAAGLAARGTVLAGKGVGRSAGRAASAASGAGGLAVRGAAAAGKGIGRAVVRVPRTLYFLASDLADYLPKPVFRPWYLAAALVVIIAVAGVPYARAWWYTPKPAAGTIRVESGRPDAVVTIDGVAHGRAPLTASVPVGRHRIEITGAGQTRTQEVEVAAGRETLVMTGGADPKGLGSIRVTTDPPGVEVLVDGVLHGRSPLTIDGLAEGPHAVLVRDGSGLVRRTVRVRADQVEDATLQIRPGWLAVFAPVKVDIFENGRPIGSTEGGRVLSAPGPHTIELVSRSMGFRETLQVDIKPGEVAAVTVQLPPVTIEIVAPEEAEILVDGQSVGQAPLGPLKVAVGTREIVMRHPTLGERRQVVTVTYNAPARVVFE